MQRNGSQQAMFGLQSTGEKNQSLESGKQERMTKDVSCGNCKRNSYIKSISKLYEKLVSSCFSWSI